jgi:ankyrin repeat protein
MAELVYVSSVQDGKAPLHLAVWRCHTDIVAELLEKGNADANVQDKVLFLFLFLFVSLIGMQT